MASKKPVMYGIPNCNTVKKARQWLQDHDIEYEFHDYKKAGTDEKLLQAWVKEFGWDKVINKRGMTWRKLDDEVKNTMNETTAIEVMMEKPSIIKRPLLAMADRNLLGFDESTYQQALIES